jgi:SAM-dependent methyltransferase
VKRLAGAHELLDGPLDPSMLAGNLRDLARINRVLGGSELSRRALAHVLAGHESEWEVSLLDIGTGAADIPLSLVASAGRAGRRLRADAIDIRPEIVALARRRVADAFDGAAGSSVRVSLADPGSLPYADGAYDVVHASLVLHHHDEQAARELLGELARVCRWAVIVNDLERARRWLLAAWLLSRLGTGNRYTRHDAPLSVRRAYTADELGRLATTVGLAETARFRDRLGHRYALVLEPTR